MLVDVAHLPRPRLDLGVDDLIAGGDQRDARPLDTPQSMKCRRRSARPNHDRAAAVLEKKPVRLFLYRRRSESRFATATRRDGSRPNRRSVSSVYSTITTASASGGIMPPVEMRIASPLLRPLRRFFAHLHDAGEFQISRQTLTGAEGVFGSDRITIHRGAVKMRQIDCREKIFGQDPSASLHRRDGFAAHRLTASNNPNASWGANTLKNVCAISSCGS